MAESLGTPSRTKVLVCVITCRRLAGLSRLMEALLQQNVASCEFAILIVDNAVEKEVEALVAELGVASRVPLHYLVEPQPGIVFARNRCVSEFLAGDYDHLVFVDDDEWPASDDWLERLVSAWRRYGAAVVTSHVVSVGEPGTPQWALEVIYGTNPFSEGDEVGAFYTNNLLLTRKVLEEISPAFDDRFAMTGASDYHFALKCQHRGFAAVYTDAPVVEEFPRDRATVSWFMRRGFRSGVGYTRSHLFEEGILATLGRAIFMASGRLASGFLVFLGGLLQFSTAGRVRGLFRMASGVGTLAGLTGVTHEEYRHLHDGSA